MTKSPGPMPPPEAALIKEALRRSGITVEEAARQVPLSKSRWWQITSGYQTVGGQRVPVRAPADTLARMSLVVGVSAAELREAGRDDAADVLETLAPPPEVPAASPYPSDPHLDAIAALLATLPPEAQTEVLRRVGRTPAPSTPPARTDVQRRAAG